MLEVSKNQVKVLYTTETKAKYFLCFDEAHEYCHSAEASDTDDYFGVKVTEDFTPEQVPLQGQMWVSHGLAEGQKSFFDDDKYDDAELIAVKVV